MTEPKPDIHLVAFRLKHLVNNYTINEKGCWCHNNKPNEKGYVSLLYLHKYPYKVHRLSYIINKGNIPEGMFVLHICDTPNCINPEHLYLGTHQDNMRDMKERERGSNQYGGKLKEFEIEAIIFFHKEGKKQQEIADLLGISNQVVSNYLKEVI